METLDVYFMNEALSLAQKAFQIEEVPIGAVITLNNKIIGRGYNQRSTKKSPLAHAEIQAIEEAASFIGIGV